MIWDEKILLIIPLAYTAFLSLYWICRCLEEEEDL